MAAGASTAFGFWLVPADLAHGLVQRFGYVIALAGMLALVLALAALVADPDLRPRFDADDRKLAAAALAGAALLQFLEPHGFKVLMDELVLQGTSMTMHFEREILVPLSGHLVDGEFTVMGGIVDKRPNAFPLLTSLVHDVTGYRTGNVFALNAALTGLLLFLVGRLSRHLGGRLEAGLFAVLLLLGLPLLVLNATGAGMEVLNLVMITACILLGRRYVREPGPITQNALIMAAVILAQTRYESAAFVAAVGALIVWVWWRERRPVVSWALVAAPILLILIPLQNKVFAANPVFWQLPDEVEAPFGLQHMGTNLARALEFMFALDGTRLGSPLLTLAGLGALATALLLAWRDRPRLADHAGFVAYGLFTVVVLGNFALVLTYHWGRLDDFTAARLGLPLLLVFAVGAGAAAGRVLPGRRVAWSIVLALPAAWLLLGAIPRSRAAEATRAWRPYLEVARQRSFVRAQADGPALFVLPSPLVALNERRASISVARLAERAEEMDTHLRLGTYRDVYVYQRLVSEPGGSGIRVSEESRLGPEFRLEPLGELALPGGALQLSRLVGVDLARALPRPEGWTPRFPREPPPDLTGLSDEEARRVLFLSSLP